MRPCVCQKSESQWLVPPASPEVDRQRALPSAGTDAHVAMSRMLPSVSSLPAALLFSFPVGGMTAKRTSRRELTELVTHHVLRHEYRNVLPAVMHSDRESDHVRDYHRPPRPCSDRPSAVHGPSCLDLTKKMVVDERAFLDRAWHSDVSPYLRLFLRRTIIVEVLLFRRVLCPFVGTPQGVTGCRPPEDRPSPPPCG